MKTLQRSRSGQRVGTRLQQGQPMRVGAAIATMVGLTGIVAFSPKPAAACSYGTDAFAGYPAASDSEVPIDVVPWFTTSGLRLEDLQVRLLGPDDVQVEVELTIVGGAWHGELVEAWPVTPLLPDSEYQLVVEADLDTEYLDDISLVVPFRTGDAPAPPPPPPPAASMELLEIQYPFANSCSPGHQGCIGAEGADTMELTVLDADDGTPLLRRFVGETVVYGYSLERPFCIELRHRTAAGVRSDATSLCSTDVPHFRAADNEYGNVYGTCHAGVFVELPELAQPSPGGCSAAWAAPSSRASATGCILLLALVALRSNRRPRAGR
jgi:hypothetical protein